MMKTPLYRKNHLIISFFVTFYNSPVLIQMLNNGTIDSLLNSSFDDELPLMPMLTHLRFGKRISKEEIRGWNTNTNISPLEDKMKEKEKKVYLGIEKDHRRHETMRNIGHRHHERNSEKHEEKH